MTKPPFFSSLVAIFTVIASAAAAAAASSSCPIDLTYVETFRWDASLCRQDPVDIKSCCQTLLSLFGIGVARHLKQTSFFQLPNSNSSSSCLSAFQHRLASLSLPPSLVPLCFSNATRVQEFVTNPFSCAGIVTIHDWSEKVGTRLTQLLASSCGGDLRGSTRCSSCLDAGLTVNSHLQALDPNATKCFHFTVLYAAGVANKFGPLNKDTAGCILGVPLASSLKTKSSTSKQVSRQTLIKLIFVFVGALIGISLALALTFMYKKWSKKRNKASISRHEAFVSSFKASVLPNSGAKWFTESELKQATDGFSQRNLMGQGAHGAVYKGKLRDSTVVAVKQMVQDPLDSQGDQEFSNEVEIISKIRHRNLLSLRGCCVTSRTSESNHRRYLVYDFMSNGSLADHLRSRNGLSWPQRKNIILDVARGIDYLHYGIEPAIYHRDIKPTNILLDSDMKAKVADFGLARQSREGESHLTTRVAGTRGYLAPEYGLYGQLTEKSDVYSFGIVVLEMMSGREVLVEKSSGAASGAVVLITDWAWEAAKRGKVAEEVVDEAIWDSGPKGIMERYVAVGMLCAHVMVAFRPTIADALKMLQGDIDIPMLPDRPLPLGHDSFKLHLDC